MHAGSWWGRGVALGRGAHGAWLLATWAVGCAGACGVGLGDATRAPGCLRRLLLWSVTVVREARRESAEWEREVGEGRSNGGGHREQGGRARRLGEKVVREIE
jgi:hypothetical protein